MSMALLWTTATPVTPQATHHYSQIGLLPRRSHLVRASAQRTFLSAEVAQKKEQQAESTFSEHAFLYGKRKLLVSASSLAAAAAASQTCPFLIAENEACAAVAEGPRFYELQGSHGVKALDIKEGSGKTPQPGDKVAIHYYARLAAKQGWRFDSTYDHKDSMGVPEPFVFTLGSSIVIQGLNSAVGSMKEGGVRRVVIPPSQGYQNTSQGPVPPNVFDRQRLYTTIFNPTRLANGEGSTLGTLIFDIELLGIRPS